MPRVPTIRAADLDRVLKALAKNGQAVDAVVVRPGGEVVITAKPAPKVTPATIDTAGHAAGPTQAAQEPPHEPVEPALTPEPPEGSLTDLERFRAEKRRRGGRAT